MAGLNVATLRKKFENGGVITAEEAKVVIDYLTEQDRVVATLANLGKRYRALEEEVQQLRERHHRV